MVRDAWLPVGFLLPDGLSVQRILDDDVDWQLYQTTDEGYALIVKESLAGRWLQAGLLEAGLLSPFAFAGEELRMLASRADHRLTPVAACQSPESYSEALAFADTLRITRRIDAYSPLHDAIFVERYSRLLPTYSLSAPVPDDQVLGAWLTGGVRVSTRDFRRLYSLTGWMAASQLGEVLERAGLPAPTALESRQTDIAPSARSNQIPVATAPFQLVGRPELERFLLEHVIDIVENPARYQALGIAFPAATILHGPPGCGKTYAVERLVEYLGWPSFEISAASVASPYIHETSRKIAEVFEQAVENAPSVLVIDEMEAFLADRQMGAGSSHHRVEEVAEFLRRIPEAGQHQVLVMAMTNRIEMIDPAILRRGRFDHVVRVEMASEAEVLALLDRLIAGLPHEAELDLAQLARSLKGRPLSDVAFVVREGARLAARAGRDTLDMDNLLKALDSAPVREGGESFSRRIRFT